MKANWKEMPLLSKLVTVCSIVVAMTVVILAFLQIFNVWAAAPYLYIPLMGVNLLLQAYTQWKSNRGVAIFSLCTAGFIFICTAVLWILP